MKWCNRKKRKKKRKKEKLERNYEQRPNPKEIYARGITQDTDELFEDYNIVEQKKRSERESNINKLKEWNRPKPDEMIARGVPLIKTAPLDIDLDKYEDAPVYGTPNASSPSKKSKLEKINAIDSFFSRNDGFEEHKSSVEQRGLVPVGYFENPELATANQAKNRLQISDNLSKRLDPKQRLSPEELHARGLVSYNVRDKALEKDDSNDNIGEKFEAFIKAAKQETFLDRMRKEQEEIRRNLEKRHRRRPSQQDLEDRGVVPKGYWQAQEVNQAYVIEYIYVYFVCLCLCLSVFTFG